MSINRVTTDGASSVCSVDSTRKFSAYACTRFRVRVADFADENDVRVLPKNGPERARERQLDLPFTCVWLTPGI
jgi:hypothetical protein